MESARGSRGALDDAALRPEPGLYVGSLGVHSGALSARQVRGPLSQAGTSRATSRRGSLREDSATLSKTDFQAKQKRGEHLVKHEKLLQQREDDLRAIRERAARLATEREQRFEAMMESITADDSMRVEAAHEIRRFERDQDRKRCALYQEWDSKVYQPVERELKKYLEDHRDVECYGDDGKPGLCPVKRDLRTQAMEDKFHRAANALIQGDARQEIDQVGLREHLRRRAQHEILVSSREATRPVYPLDLWAQLQPFAHVHAQEPQPCAGFHSARRMGTDVHRPDEQDGVLAAGKTKLGRERHCLGILAGVIAKEGESALHKMSEHGAGCGAPCQDHYRYARDTAVVDAEFPIGKRVYPKIKK